jgi:hypothetical protein
MINNSVKFMQITTWDLEKIKKTVLIEGYLYGEESEVITGLPSFY